MQKYERIGFGVEAVDIYALTTPSTFPTESGDIANDMAGKALGVGSTLYCADTGKKWILFERGETSVTWCDSSDTTSTEVVNIPQYKTIKTDADAVLAETEFFNFAVSGDDSVWAYTLPFDITALTADDYYVTIDGTTYNGSLSAGTITVVDDESNTFATIEASGITIKDSTAGTIFMSIYENPHYEVLEDTDDAMPLTKFWDWAVSSDGVVWAYTPPIDISGLTGTDFEVTINGTTYDAALASSTITAVDGDSNTVATIEATGITIMDSDDVSDKEIKVVDVTAPDDPDDNQD